MKPTERHMETARRIAAEVSIPNYAPNVMFIASALADAEREGIERAAKIASMSDQGVFVYTDSGGVISSARGKEIAKAIRALSTHPENG